MNLLRLFFNEIIKLLDTPPLPASIPLLSFLLNSDSTVSTSFLFFAIVLILILLVCSALMAGAEVAFFSLVSKDIGVIRKKYKTSADNIIQLLEEPRKLLATILIANSFMNIAVVMVVYAILHPFHFQPWLELLIEIGLVTFVLVLFGEVLPKVYASQHNIRMALLMAIPLSLLVKLFSPLSNFLILFTKIIERRLRKKKSSELDADEISHAIDIALHDKTSKQEVSILKGIARFGNISVKQIMRSRMDIVAIDYQLRFHELMLFIKDAGYSRMPVFKDEFDSIKGVLFTKDLLEHIDKEDDFDWHTLIRPPFFVPEHKKINDLLQEFQTSRMHLAIVVDEYGGTAGLATLEDIMEEIIGDIKDEFDEMDDHHYSRLNDTTFVFDGKMLLNDVCRILTIPVDSFDEVKGESDTIAGLVLELFGRIPKVDEITVFQRFEFKVQQMSKLRIARVRIELKPINPVNTK